MAGPVLFAWSMEALPRVALAGRYPLDDRAYEHTYRSADRHALHLYEYHATMQLGGGTVTLQPGDLTLSPMGGETRYDLPRPGHHWCIHFMPARLRGAPVAIPLHLRLGTLKPRAVDAIQRIAGLVAAPAAEAAYARAAADAALLELLLTLAAHAAHVGGRERAPRANLAAERAAAMLDADLANPPSAPAVARAVGLSPNWLSRAFRERYGTTMARYLLAARIAAAQDLLHTTDVPVGRIAERLGFLDAQHFNKQFRRVAGCSPSAFRLRGSKAG